MKHNKGTKGGSFLCSENFCTGYRPSARMATDPLASLGHLGFRCVKNKAVEPPIPGTAGPWRGTLFTDFD